MNRRVLACWGIVATLLFGLAGQQAFAFCTSGDHRAIEAMGHAPCGPAPDGGGLTSGQRCDDTPVDAAAEAAVHQGKRSTILAAPMPAGGGPALPAGAAALKPPRAGAPVRAVTAHRDGHLRSRRTVVLLI